MKKKVFIIAQNVTQIVQFVHTLQVHIRVQRVNQHMEWITAIVHVSAVI